MGVEEEQQIAVLGEVIVVAEAGGVAVARWSCGGVAVARRHAGPGRGGGQWWRRSWWDGEWKCQALPSAGSGRRFI